MALNNSKKKTKKEVRMTDSQEPTEAGESGSDTSPKTNRVKCYLFSWGEFVDTDIALSHRIDWCRERGLECCLFGRQEVRMAEGGRMPDSYRTRHYPDPIKDSIYCPADDEVHYFKEGDAREVCPGCKKPLDDVLKEAASA